MGRKAIPGVKEKMINTLKQFYKENGRYPYRRELHNSNGLYAYSGYCRHFGEYVIAKNIASGINQDKAIQEKEKRAKAKALQAQISMEFQKIMKDIEICLKDKCLNKDRKMLKRKIHNLKDYINSPNYKKLSLKAKQQCEKVMQKYDLLLF